MDGHFYLASTVEIGIVVISGGCGSGKVNEDNGKHHEVEDDSLEEDKIPGDNYSGDVILQK